MIQQMLKKELTVSDMGTGLCLIILSLRHVIKMLYNGPVHFLAHNDSGRMGHPAYSTTHSPTVMVSRAIQFIVNS